MNLDTNSLTVSALKGSMKLHDAGLRVCYARVKEYLDNLNFNDVGFLRDKLLHVLSYSSLYAPRFFAASF